MLSDITIGQYYKADSLIHKLDARTKILLTLWFIVMIFLCKRNRMVNGIYNKNTT